MFTGLVEEVGTIERATPHEGGRRFRIRAVRTLEGLRLGDSVSIDGACHTAVAIEDDAFEVQSVGTTLQRTTLGTFEPGRRVNLERALRVGDRLGGHMVQGHVDGVGEVRSIERRGEHVLIDFTLPEVVASATILHGSITVNGISLTVNDLPAAAVCQVSIIPHTWEATNLPDLRVGDGVNLEGDLIARYVRQLLGRPGAGGVESGGAEAEHLRRGWGY